LTIKHNNPFCNLKARKKVYHIIKKNTILKTKNMGENYGIKFS